MEASSTKLPSEKAISNEYEKPEDQIPKFKELIYWIQIIISVIFGISTYYLVEIGWPSWAPVIPFMRIAGNFVVILGLYLISFLVIPFLIMFIGCRENLKESLIGPLRNIGTNFLLYLLLCGIVFMLNIR